MMEPLTIVMLVFIVALIATFVWAAPLVVQAYRLTRSAYMIARLRHEVRDLKEWAAQRQPKVSEALGQALENIGQFRFMTASMNLYAAALHHEDYVTSLGVEIWEVHARIKELQREAEALAYVWRAVG